ncbi:unnamed protein product, partial [Heterotrigona itama]
MKRGFGFSFRSQFFFPSHIAIEVQLLFITQAWIRKFRDHRRTEGALIESYDLAARLVYASVKDMKQLGFKRGFVGDYPGLGHTLHDAWIFA